MYNKTIFHKQTVMERIKIYVFYFSTVPWLIYMNTSENILSFGYYMPQFNIFIRKTLYFHLIKF